MLRNKHNQKNKGMTMMLVILLCAALMLFDLLVHLWGVDSTDGIESAEWERHAWRNSTTPD